MQLLDSRQQTHNIFQSQAIIPDMESQSRELTIYETDDGLLLLWGGDKSTQDRDIQKAKQFWSNFNQRDNANE